MGWYMYSSVEESALRYRLGVRNQGSLGWERYQGRADVHPKPIRRCAREAVIDFHACGTAVRVHLLVVPRSQIQ